MVNNMIKVILFGDTNTGKSQLLNRIEHGGYSEMPNSTVGVEFGTRRILNDRYKLQIWDTAGQQKFRAVISSYKRGAQIGIYCHDVSKEIDSQKIYNDIKDFKALAGDQARVIIVLTKNDLYEGKELNHQQVFQGIDTKAEEFKQLCIHPKVFSTSAKRYEGIDALLSHIASIAPTFFPDQQLDEPAVIDLPTTPNSKGFFGRHWKGILATTLSVATAFAIVGAGLGIGMSITSTIPTFGLSLLLTPVAIAILAGVGFGVGALVGFLAAVVGFALSDRKGAYGYGGGVAVVSHDYGDEHGHEGEQYQPDAPYKSKGLFGSQEITLPKTHEPTSSPRPPFGSTSDSESD